ncbi:helix-turn-helix transcriptional regulator [Spirillospora sp. NPDC047279]|uniref:helix-turn-helix transcriptional regulator n=1 Tax=Spirillospora sp. NPDC047279 TaxID=3155478 RepID=UPI0033E9ED18
MLNLVANGLSDNEIAATLVLSPETVKTCVSRILTRLDSATASKQSSTPTATTWSPDGGTSCYEGMTVSSPRRWNPDGL